MSEILSRAEFGTEKERDGWQYQERISAQRTFALEDTIEALAEALKMSWGYLDGRDNVPDDDDFFAVTQPLRTKGWL